MLVLPMAPLCLHELPPISFDEADCLPNLRWHVRILPSVAVTDPCSGRLTPEPLSRTVEVCAVHAAFHLRQASSESWPPLMQGATGSHRPRAPPPRHIPTNL